MRRMLVFATALAAALATASPALAGHGLERMLDHPAPGTGATTPGGTVNSGGPGATWNHVATVATGNPHTDLDFFTLDGESYASVGTLAAGLNAGGQTIVKLTEDGELDSTTPQFITGHGSGSCFSDPLQALGLQHDVEATPKGRGTILNTANPAAVRTTPQLLIDATDNPGRCHDQGVAGVIDAPQGGLELIDITKLARLERQGREDECTALAFLGPEQRCVVEIGLTSHIGESHTVNVDPKRPHIAYSVTSDAVSVSGGQRENEIPGDNDRRDLDGFEVVDMSSCMNFPRGTSVAVKREQCRPEVYRYRYPTLQMSLGHTVQNTVYGCHELEVYPDDRLMCGSGAAEISFDMSGAFDDNGTPNDFSDDTPNGEPLDCRVRPSSTAGPTRTDAKVSDCVREGEGDTPPGSALLDVPNWIADGSPSLEGVEYLGTIHHMGRGGPRPSTEDIDFDHEAELSASRRLILATDERGGGVTPPGATCATGVDNPQGNGGVHFYRYDRLTKDGPSGPAGADAQYARTPGGEKAIYRATPRTGAEATTCTAHVFQQVPGQNRIFMGWYSQGTQVIDFVENEDGTVELKEAGWFIPPEADEWVSHIFRTEENGDGTVTYWGAIGDFVLGRGRNVIDVYSVTLPAPPSPLGGGDGDGDGDDGRDDDDDDGRDDDDDGRDDEDGRDDDDSDDDGDDSDDDDRDDSDDEDGSDD